MDNKGEYTFPDLALNGHEQKPKTTRKRKEWVYKSQYDLLQRKYWIIQWIALIGWLGFIITLKTVI